MNKYLVSFVSLLVGLGLGFPLFHNGANQNSGPLGGPVKQESSFIYGLKAGETDQFAVSSAGALTSSGAVTLSGALTVSNSGNVGATTTTAGGVVTATVRSGAICVASDATATGTISTYASTTGTTLTIKGTPSHLFQYVCF